MMFKRMVKLIIPPILVNIAHNILKNDIVWKGNYIDWNNATAASSGYDADAIFQNVIQAARQVRDGKALWERDSVCFDNYENIIGHF